MAYLVCICKECTNCTISFAPIPHKKIIKKIVNIINKVLAGSQYFESSYTK